MEDFRMQLKAQANHIAKVLQKPQSQRMPFEGVQIAKSLSKIRFFSNFFDIKSEPFVSLCISSQLKTVPQGQNIYETIQDEPKGLYLILEGTAIIKSNNNQQSQIYQPLGESMQSKNKITASQNILNMKGKQFKFLQHSDYQVSQFDHFGQVEAVFKISQRNQKVFAKTQCKIMVLRNEDLRDIWLSQSLANASKFMHYILVHPYFQKISYFDKQILSILMVKQAYIQGSYLLKQRDPVYRIMFIVYGNISVIKNLPLKDSSNKNNFYNANLKINELTQMETVGEYQCVNNCSSQVTLIAENFGCFYYIKYDSLIRFNHPLINKIKEKALPYPSDQQLQFLFKTKGQLMTQQVKIEKQNRLGNYSTKNHKQKQTQLKPLKL